MRTGILFAATAYTTWGLFPLYFKALQTIPPEQIVLHRIVWSLVFLTIVLIRRRQLAWLGEVARKPKVLVGFAASALLLSVNWLIYIWAVQNGRVVDASLGYFINPLVSVLLGLLLLGERLRPMQWTAIGVAVAGVAWLTWQSGQLPWVALSLAVTFGLYGLLRKTAVLGALEGLALETLLLFPFAMIWLAVLSFEHRTVFFDVSFHLQALLTAAGPITAIPLLLFASGARRIPLSLLGMLQYIVPTLQLLIGVWMYHEPFGEARLTGFALIWSALAVYSLESLWQNWKRKEK